MNDLSPTDFVMFLCCRPAEPPTLSKASGEMLDKASDLSSLLPFAARVCLESTASDDHHWHLTSSWLTQQLQKLLPKGCGSGHDAVHLSKLSEVITCTMAAVFSHPLMGKIQEGNKILSGTAGGRNAWNIFVFQFSYISTINGDDDMCQLPLYV